MLLELTFSFVRTNSIIHQVQTSRSITAGPLRNAENIHKVLQR